MLAGWMAAQVEARPMMGLGVGVTQWGQMATGMTVVAAAWDGRAAVVPTEPDAGMVVAGLHGVVAVLASMELGRVVSEGVGL